MMALTLMTRVARLAFCALSLAAFVGARPVHAEQPVPLERSSSLAPTTRPKAVVIAGAQVAPFDFHAIVTQVIRGLEKGGVEAVEPIETFASYGECKGECRDDARLARIASSAQAGFVVRVEVQRQGNAIDAFILELTPWNAETKVNMPPHGPTCGLCGQAELAAIALQGGEFVARQLKAAAIAGVKIVPGTAPTPVYRPLWQRLLPWAGVAAGVGAGAWGVHLLSINNQGSCGGGDDCHYLYDTRGRGLAYLVGGGIAVAGSAAMLYILSRPVSLEVGPSSIALSGRF